MVVSPTSVSQAGLDFLWGSKNSLINAADSADRPELLRFFSHTRIDISHACGLNPDLVRIQSTDGVILIEEI
jgi:hypothetical protein